MTTYTQPNNLADLLQYELDKFQSREQVTVLSGESVAMGEVVGAITKSTPATGTKDDDNTGAGTVTAVTAGDSAEIGTYTLECTAYANSSSGSGSIWSVSGPDGFALPDAEGDISYTNDQINFLVNDTGTAFIVGDTFTIAVAAGSGSVVPIDFTAVDGSQDAYGFMVDTCDASDAATEGVAIVRDAQIVANYLTWPDGATDAQKAAALAQLKAKGIVERTEV
jgi:hypothetical protein